LAHQVYENLVLKDYFRPLGLGEMQQIIHPPEDDSSPVMEFMNLLDEMDYERLHFKCLDLDLVKEEHLITFYLIQVVLGVACVYETQPMDP